MIVIGFAIGYYFLFLVIIYGLARTKKQVKNSIEKYASVIICARNEGKILNPLLTSLEGLTYNYENYEIILVDDDSTDNTSEIMQEYCNRHTHWKYLFHKKTPASYKGKKGALDFGIQNSKYEIILATDADCVVKSSWIQSMLSCFEKNTAMVQGYSPIYKPRGFLSKYQQFDTLAEGVTAAASFYFNDPSHANARNFAFRKSAYNEVQGFSTISNVDTGDDFYLARLIKNETNLKFKYNIDQDSFVTTIDVDNLEDYWHQQLRRNSKGFDLDFNFFIIFMYPG